MTTTHHFAFLEKHLQISYQPNPKMVDTMASHTYVYRVSVCVFVCMCVPLIEWIFDVAVLALRGRPQIKQIQDEEQYLRHI